ncbi:MAG TPA: 1-(5-phosphoribosyl)-5-amino-4-imidazole-carboxylate carboxylase, partial [Actinomycetota bacterium]
MTSRREIEDLLLAVAEHEVDPEAAADRLAQLPFRDLGFARVDTHRELRQGAPEAILGEGKTPEEAAAIAKALDEAGASSVLVTRASSEMRAAVREAIPDAIEDERARAVWVEHRPLERRGRVL